MQPPQTSVQPTDRRDTQRGGCNPQTREGRRNTSIQIFLERNDDGKDGEIKGIATRRLLSLASLVQWRISAHQFNFSTGAGTDYVGHADLDARAIFFKWMELGRTTTFCMLGKLMEDTMLRNPHTEGAAQGCSPQQPTHTGCSLGVQAHTNKGVQPTDKGMCNQQTGRGGATNKQGGRLQPTNREWVATNKLGVGCNQQTGSGLQPTNQGGCLPQTREMQVANQGGCKMQTMCASQTSLKAASNTFISSRLSRSSGLRDVLVQVKAHSDVAPPLRRERLTGCAPQELYHKEDT